MKDNHVLGKYTAPAASVQGEELVQGNSAVASTSVRSPETERLSTPASLLERLRSQATDATDFHGETMKKWDEIRAACLKFRGSDLPRLMFESLIESLAETMIEAADEIERLHTQVGDNLTGASTGDDGNCPQSAAYQRIDELKASLTEMVGIYWGEGDGIHPPPACIQRAMAALTDLEPFPAESGAHSA